MGKPFSIDGVCSKCRIKLSRCALTYFILKLHSIEFNDSKLIKLLKKYNSNSRQNRDIAFEAIRNCGYEEVKRIVVYAYTRNSRLRELNKLNVKRPKITRCAKKLLEIYK